MKNREETNPIEEYLEQSRKATKELWGLYAKITEMHESRENDMFKFNILSLVMGHSHSVIQAIAFNAKKE